MLINVLLYNRGRLKLNGLNVDDIRDEVKREYYVFVSGDLY